MSLPRNKHLTPHKHLSSDIIGSAFYPPLVTGGKTGVGDFNGGTIHLPLELEVKMPYCDESLGELKDWMFLEPASLPDPVSFIRFKDVNETGNYTDLYGLIVSNGVDEAPAVCCNHHIVGRKDLNVRGMLASYEGIVAVNGGYTDWAPSDNPMVWLREGGIYGTNNTLEIRVITSAEGGFTWGYGNFACAEALCSLVQFAATADGATRIAQTTSDVISIQSYDGVSTWALANLNVGTIFVDHINSASAGGIYLFDHIRFYTGAAGVKLYDATNDSGSEGEVLKVNASGLPVWASDSAGNWTADAVSVVDSPLSVAAGHLQIAAASTSANGYLSSTDWNTFNSKYGSGSLSPLSADVGFNSVTGINAVKLGTYGSTVFDMTYDATYVYLNNSGARDTYLGTTAGKKVIVQRDLQVLGTLLATVSNAVDADTLDSQHGSFYQNASNLNDGTVPTARLGSGTANNTTYLRGDSTWQTLPSAQWTAGAVSSVTSPLAISAGALVLNQGSLSIGTGQINNWSSADLVVNSIKGTASAGALKAGDDFAISWDGDYIYLNNTAAKDTYLGNTSGKGVRVQNFLTVGGICSITGDFTAATSYLTNIYGGSGTLNFKNDANFEAQLAVKKANPAFYLNDASGDTKASFGWNGSVVGITGQAGDIVVTSAANIVLAAGSSSDVYVWGGHHIIPQSANGGACGYHLGNYWYEIAGNHIYGKESHLFDAYDDLDLVKQWGEPHPEISAKYDPEKIKPPSGDIFAILRGQKENGEFETNTGFIDIFSMGSFALGCAKALAKKQDENEARFLALLNEIDSLKGEIAKLKDKTAA